VFENSLNELQSLGLLRSLRTVESVDGARAVIDGKPVTLFCTNDYLGLTGHTAVIDAAKEAVDSLGFGSGSAPLIAGRTVYQARLEEELARFKGADAALVFGSGYLANTGLIPALAREGDLILSDSLNHASIIDGCRLSRAEVEIYNHRDVRSLSKMLGKAAGYRKLWIVTEGVFGMDGDIAPMPEIVRLADKHGATIILDDAHGTGVLGHTGRGTLEHFGLAADGVIQMGTLGKALGSYGAFVAAGRDVIDYLVNTARGFMFSTALPPAACAAASASLILIDKEPEMLARLKRNAQRFRDSLNAFGFSVIGEGTPVIPVLTGEADKAVRLSRSLIDEGFYAPAIRPPTVPVGGSRIRFTLSAVHTDDDIDSLIDTMNRLAWT